MKRLTHCKLNAHELGHGQGDFFPILPMSFNLRSLFVFLTVCAALFAVVRWSGPAWPHLTGILLAAAALTWFWRSRTGRHLRRSRKGIGLFLLASLAISCPSYMVGELILWVAEQFGLVPGSI